VDISEEMKVSICEELLDELDANELYLLMWLVVLGNTSNESYPSNVILIEKTKWAIEKLQFVKKSLTKKGIIEITHGGGRFSNKYTIKTPLIKGVEYSSKEVTVHGHSQARSYMDEKGRRIILG
jgi:hypothetical protein